MNLRPQVRQLLGMVYRPGAPKFHELSVELARRSFSKLVLSFRPAAPAVASVLDIPIMRRDGSALMSRLYRPRDSVPTDILPVLVFLHGGGWCVGDIDSYDVLCRQLANGSCCAVFSVDYRLAPEHPFPAAIDDTLLAYRWLLSKAVMLSLDPGRVAVGGDSAGGNLSIVLALSVGLHNLPVPRHLLLVYPCTEIVSVRPSRERYAKGFLLDRESLDWFFGHYLGGESADDWRASPLLAKSFAGLPGISLLTAEHDPLNDDCLAFADRVREAGVDIRCNEVSGVVHGFVTLGKLIPEADLAVDWMSRRVREALCLPR